MSIHIGDPRLEPGGVDEEGPYLNAVLPVQLVQQVELNRIEMRIVLLPPAVVPPGSKIVLEDVDK